MKAWHFVGNKLMDGRPIPPDGEWLVHEGELIMCKSGLHASIRLIDALKYVPGNTICRVEVDGEVIEDDDKLVAQKRKILWRINGEAVLRAFARWCALQYVHLWVAPDVVIEYLTKGGLDLMVAARAAVEDASRAASRAAVEAAAWDVVEDAAWDTAWVAAWAAVWVATRDAVEAASRDVQNEQLELMVEEAKDGKTEWIFDVP